MKIESSNSILAALAVVLLTAVSAHGDDKKAKDKPAEAAVVLPSEVTEALKKAGVDPETIGQIQSAVTGAEGVSVSTIMIGPDGKVISKSTDGKKADDSTKAESGKKKEGEKPAVSISTTVVGPDGKVITRSGGEKIELDLGKVIAEVMSVAGTTSSEAEGEDSVKADVSISGKVVIVGEDGKVTTQSLGDVEGSDALQKALGEALGGIDIKVLQGGDSKAQTQVFGFGTPMIQDGDLSDRLSEIEKKLETQQELLEKILEKL